MDFDYFNAIILTKMHIKCIEFFKILKYIYFSLDEKPLWLELTLP